MNDGEHISYFFHFPKELVKLSHTQLQVQVLVAFSLLLLESQFQLDQTLGVMRHQRVFSSH